MRLRKSLQLFANRNVTRFKAQAHTLDYLFWEATLKCNYTCLHCGSDCRKENAIADLSGEKVISVFKNIAENYDATKIMVAVTGGEALMRKDLFQIMKQVSALGFPWGLVTNGFLVNKKIVAIAIDAGMKTVSVSLDGLEKSHNYLRNNKQAFQKSIQAISLVKKQQASDVVDVITCVNPNNIQELESIYQLLELMQVDSWRMFSIFPKGRAAENSNLVITQELLNTLFQFIKQKKLETKRMKVNYSEEGFLGCDWEGVVRSHLYYCGAGINIASLLADGSYSACPSLAREWIQGHVDHMTFSDVWENKYKNMRDRNWRKNEICKDCEQWKNCKASSLHLWDWKKNQPTICHYNWLSEEN